MSTVLKTYAVNYKKNIYTGSYDNFHNDMYDIGKPLEYYGYLSQIPKNLVNYEMINAMTAHDIYTIDGRHAIAGTFETVDSEYTGYFRSIWHNEKFAIGLFAYKQTGSLPFTMMIGYNLKEPWRDLQPNIWYLNNYVLETNASSWNSQYEAMSDYIYIVANISYVKPNYTLLWVATDHNNLVLKRSIIGFPGDLTNIGFELTTDYPPSVTPGDLPEVTDPYDTGGDSTTGGGTGTFDDTSTPIDFPVLPTFSAADTGFITLFNPTLSQVKSLAEYMWGPLFDVDTLKKIVSNPMDTILGLSTVPVAVPNGGTRNVVTGNIDTGVSMIVAGSQYVAVDCGTLNVAEYWGAYLDYSPYTKAELFLPYIGVMAVDVDDFMNKDVHIVYHVDILSGACIAYVKCGESVLYSYAGQCSAEIPISSLTYSNILQSAISIATTAASIAFSGGLTAAQGIKAAGSVANSLSSAIKPTVQKSTTLGGASGLMAIQTPYLILTRPRQALPANQNKYTGYPSFIAVNMSDLSGYTEIEECHLEGMSATDAEVSEIMSLLKGGVIF